MYKLFSVLRLRTTTTRLAIPFGPHSCCQQLVLVRWATKKAGGTVRNKPGSRGKHLGLKCAGGETVKAGRILVRQRGTETHPGLNVHLGRDDTLTALTAGQIHFTYVLRKHRRSRRWRKFINVLNPKLKQTRESVDKLYRDIQNEYYQVLKMKKDGVKIPTSRSIFVKQQRSAQSRGKQKLWEAILKEEEEEKQAKLNAPTSGNTKNDAAKEQKETA